VLLRGDQEDPGLTNHDVEKGSINVEIGENQALKE
jgi:hypothetical protein